LNKLQWTEETLLDQGNDGQTLLEANKAGMAYTSLLLLLMVMIMILRSATPLIGL